MPVEISKSDLLEALSYIELEEESDVRWGYSGRSMYGRTCFGFVGSMEDYGTFLLALVDVYYDQTEDINVSRELAGHFVERCCTDSMGYSTIFYFPGIQVLENE